MKANNPKSHRTAALQTPTDLNANAVMAISNALNVTLADMFGLYIKTKNFHWHMSGPHFRDYHLLLDEQVAADFAVTDDDRRTRAQDRRGDAAFDRPDGRAAARHGQ